MAEVPLRRRVGLAPRRYQTPHQVGGDPGLPVHDDPILVPKADFTA
jgi:hypothetical protein